MPQESLLPSAVAAGWTPPLAEAGNGAAADAAAPGWSRARAGLEGPGLGSWRQSVASPAPSPPPPPQSSPSLAAGPRPGVDGGLGSGTVGGGEPPLRDDPARPAASAAANAPPGSVKFAVAEAPIAGSRPAAAAAVLGAGVVSGAREQGPEAISAGKAQAAAGAMVAPSPTQVAGVAAAAAAGAVASSASASAPAVSLAPVSASATPRPARPGDALASSSPSIVANVTSPSGVRATTDRSMMAVVGAATTGVGPGPGDQAPLMAVVKRCRTAFSVFIAAQAKHAAKLLCMAPTLLRAPQAALCVTLGAHVHEPARAWSAHFVCLCRPSTSPPHTPPGRLESMERSLGGRVDAAQTAAERATGEEGRRRGELAKQMTDRLEAVEARLAVLEARSKRCCAVS